LRRKPNRLASEHWVYVLQDEDVWGSASERFKIGYSAVSPDARAIQEERRLYEWRARSGEDRQIAIYTSWRFTCCDFALAVERWLIHLLFELGYRCYDVEYHWFIVPLHEVKIISDEVDKFVSGISEFEGILALDNIRDKLNR
jgi:hypothetical protein